jgi:hypothetical protein
MHGAGNELFVDFGDVFPTIRPTAMAVIRTLRRLEPESHPTESEGCGVVFAAPGRLP